MDKGQFLKTYSGLAGYLAGDFYDCDDRSDEQIALDMLNDLTDQQRLEVLASIVRQANRLMLALHDEWEVFANTVNRDFQDEAAAREWLVRMLAVWERELSKLDGSKPS